MPRNCFPLSCVWCYGCWIPQRWVTAVFAFLGLVISVQLRTCLNFTIVMMVAPENKTESNGEEEIGGEMYEWSEVLQGTILGSFFYGYIVSQIPGAYLADVFGGKWPIATGVVVMSVTSLFIPFLTSIGDYPALIVLRVIQGFGAGTIFCVMGSLVSRWAPSKDRTKMSSLMFSGSMMGNAIGNSLTGVISFTTGYWPTSYYVYGVLGIMWFLLFSILVYNDIYDHPFITERELEYLKKEVGPKRRRNFKVPVLKILTSLRVWALVFPALGHDFCLYILMNDLPKYLYHTLGFNIKQSSAGLSIPYIATWLVAVGSGWLADYIRQKEIISPVFLRKSFTTVGLSGPGVFLVLAANSQIDNKVLVILMFSLCLGCMGFFNSSFYVNFVEISPTYASIIISIGNTIGASMGAISAFMVGYICKNQTKEEWRLVFWITFFICMWTNLIYLLFATVKVQKWDPQYELVNRSSDHVQQTADTHQTKNPENLTKSQQAAETRQADI